MSRARDWTHPVTGRVYWFDAYGEATVEQIEVLAEMEGVEVDDLLDERLSTRAVLYRLNHNSGLIPHEIIAQKRGGPGKYKYKAPVCRFHPDPTECEGVITKHHFVPRWLMLELRDYVDYAPRSYCTIPACVGIHRFLHKREGGASKSVASALTDDEKNLAEHLIRSLKAERPSLYNLIAQGDRTSYEWQLIHDYETGRFRVSRFRRVLRRIIWFLARNSGG